jgi:hypothetical protein
MSITFLLVPLGFAIFMLSFVGRKVKLDDLEDDGKEDAA